MATVTGITQIAELGGSGATAVAEISAETSTFGLQNFTNGGMYLTTSTRANTAAGSGQPTVNSGWGAGATGLSLDFSAQTISVAFNIAQADTAGLNAKAAGGLSVRVFSGDAWKDFYVGGSDTPAANDITHLLCNIDVNEAADATSGTFDPTNITAIHCYGRKPNTTNRSIYPNRLLRHGALVMTGTGGTFQDFFDHTITFNTFLNRRFGDNLYYYYSLLEIGDGSTATVFSDSIGTVEFLSRSTTASNPATNRIPVGGSGLVIKDDCTISDYLLIGNSVAKLEVTSADPVLLSGATVLEFAQISLNSNTTCDAVSFRRSQRVVGNGAVFDDCIFQNTQSTTGAVTPLSASAFNSNYSNIRFIQNTVGPALHLNQAGTYDLSEHIFEGNTTNATIDGVAATLELSAAQFSAYNTDPANFPITTINGGSVTVTGPSAATVFSGFPTSNNANGVAPAPVIGFYDADFAYIDGLDDGDTEYSAGTFTVLLSDYAGVAYVVGDAIGWIRTDFIPVDASNPPGAVSLAAAFREIVDEEGDALVGLGTTEGKAKLTYDQANTRFEVAAGAITFSDTLDKKEDLTSDLLGLANFNTSVVRGIQFISNKYGNEILLPSPLTISANATALTSPILTNFLVIRSGDPTADPFEHGLASDAVGLDTRPEIRVNSTKFIAATEGGGGGLDAAGVRSAIGLASANLDTQLSTIDTVVDAILVDTAEIGAAGAGLTDAGGTGDHLSAIPTIANVTTVGTVTNAVTTTTPPLDATETQAAAAAALNAYDPPTRAELTSDIGTVTTAIADVPTVAEFEARTLPSADYFVVGDYTSSLPQNFAALAITEAGLVTATNGGGSGGGEIDLGLTGFITLMRSDLAYRRLAAEAQGIPSLADELALIRTQVWSSVEVRTAWNAALGTEGITAPSTGEIALWNGYLTATGFDGISFGTGGVVS